MSLSRSLFAISLLVCALSLSAQNNVDPSGHWEGIIHAPATDVVVAVDLAKNATGDLTGTFSNAADNIHDLPLANVRAKGNVVTFAIAANTCEATIDGKSMKGKFTMRASNSQSVDMPLELTRINRDDGATTLIHRWANALGGREKLASIKTLYREATVEMGTMKGTIKVWHTSDGRYHKEEQVGAFSSIETFDGTNGTLQQGDLPPHAMAGADLERARSTAFANWSAVFFALFPDRRRGTIATEGDDTIVMKPEGGIDWHVTFDASTSLPKTMTHLQNNRTITVTFVAYEPVDGIPFEKEIHRLTGDPRFDAVIRFTKTIINPPLDASFFTIEPKTIASNQ